MRYAPGAIATIGLGALVLALAATLVLFMPARSSAERRAPTEPVLLDMLGNPAAPTAEPASPVPSAAPGADTGPYPPTALPAMARSPVGGAEVRPEPAGHEAFDPSPAPPTADRLSEHVALRTQRRFIPTPPEAVREQSGPLISHEEAIRAAQEARPALVAQASAISALLGWYGQPTALTAAAGGTTDGEILVWWVTLSGIVQHAAGGPGVPSTELHLVLDASTGKVLFEVAWSAVPRDEAP